MSSREKPSSTKIFSVLGWIIAALALILNYLQYDQSQHEKEIKEQREPIYTASLVTHNPSGLPNDILKIKAPIKHEFEISYYSGDVIEDLVISFVSDDKPIQEIKVSEGIADTDIKIEEGKLEASLKKSRLLKNMKLNGYVLTDGITELRWSTGAGKGRELGQISEMQDNDIGTKDGIIIFPLIIVIVGFVALGIVLGLLFHKVNSYGVLNDLKQEKDNLPLLVLLLFLFIIVDSFQFGGMETILKTVVVYFLITRYKLIIKIQEKLEK